MNAERLDEAGRRSARVRPEWIGLLAASASLIALTGCYKVNMSIEVDDDGSGEATVIMAVDPDAIETLLGPMAETFGDTDEFSRDELCSPEALAETFGATGEATVEPYDEDGFCGEVRTMQFDDVDGFDASMSEFDDDGGTFEIARTPDGGWRFEATDVSTAPADDEGMDDFIDAEVFETLLGDAEIVFQVTLPGRPVDHNATSVDGNTFTWDLDVTDPLTELYAETEPGEPGGSSAWVWIVVVLGALAVIGLVAWVLLRRRSASDAERDGPGDPGEGGQLAGASLPPPPPPHVAPVTHDAPPTPPPPPGAGDAT